MQDGREITMDEWKEMFTVFLTAFDFNTSASLTTTVSQTVFWACRSLGDRMGTTVQSQSHTATTTSVSLTSQRVLPLVLSRQTCIFQSMVVL